MIKSKAVTPHVGFEQALAKAAKAVDRKLNALVPRRKGNRLQDAMRYALLSQGKRLRPFLVLESARLHKVSPARALNVAAALEMVHCYSLIHDDLPAMDDDDLRRGKPTTHVKFDEATAILAGDALLTKAFEVLGDAKEPPGLIAALARAAGSSGMVGGQMLDIEAESKGFKSLKAISAMQAKKTGALFAFACVSGPLMAKANAKPMRNYAEAIGLAFQIADDVLDVESEPATLGKATQKDKGKGKATFIDFLGLEGAKREATSLVIQAKAALKPYGAKANVLNDAADFIIARKK